MTDADWARRVATLAVDALATAKLLSEEALEKAEKIVAEEIFVRLCLGDRPDKGQSDE